MTDVKGKYALITGASRGIGKRIAEFMAKEGCNLVLQARKKEHLENVLAEVQKTGVIAYCVECELSDMKSVENMINEIEKLNVQIDILFNDAGVQVAYRKEYFETPVSDFTTSYLINTIAPAMLCYHFLPKMKQANFGRIINTTSGIKNEPEQAGYSCSKAALDKFTKDLANTVNGTDVIISLADPGWCRTDLGGPNAPNDPYSALPGMVMGAFVDDKISGRLFGAQDFAGLSLEEAVKKAESQKVL